MNKISIRNGFALLAVGVFLVGGIFVAKGTASAIAAHTLTYTTSGNGEILGSNPQVVTDGGDGTAVTASGDAGYHFVNWSEDSSTSNPRTDTNVTADHTFTANFAINTYTLTYTAGANGSITGTSPQTVNHGANGTAVTAVPNSGFHFVNWSNGSTSNPRTDNGVTGNISVTANFAANAPGTITLSSPTLAIWPDNKNIEYPPYAPNTIFQANVNFDGGVKLFDFKSVVISLYSDDTLLATNTAKPALFSSYPDAVGVTDLFGKGDTADADADPNWIIGGYSPNINPNKVKFTLIAQDDSVHVADGTLDAESAGILLGNRFADAATGNDTNDCLTSTTACKTINAAVAKAPTNGTVYVAAGTYPEHVAVNKSVTFKGANVGVAGNGSRGAESIVDGTDTGAPFAITANGVTINGFTIKNGSNGGLDSGIWSQTGTQNSSILNNIITGNDFGVWAQCGGTCLIQNNLFDGNNKPGSGSGSASISADSTTGLTIDNNEFKNDTAGNPILLQAVAAGAHTNVIVSNNNMHNNTYSNAYIIGVTGGSFSGNTITPASDATGISFSGEDTNITVSKNIITGAARGIRVENVYGANSNITVNKNNVSSNSGYGVGNTDAGITNLDATCNWWGQASGPGPVGPGAGSPVTANVNFTSWLTTSDLNGPCNGPVVTPPPSNGGGGGGRIVPPPAGQVLGASTGPVPGCGNRTSGFSVTTGQSCVGNTGDGCDNRTTGFSTITGQSCTGNGQVLGAAKFIFTLFLKKGPPYHFSTWGKEVMELQKFLNAGGYDCGVVDGLFGLKTKSCVVKFQLANGLVGDGIVGPLTRAVLNK
jgi:hypothetical protein